MRSIKKNEEKIRASVATSAPQNSKTSCVTRDPYIEQLEKGLTIWIEDQSQRKVALSGQIIREKALKLYKHLSQPNEEKKEFLASKGWFENFKRRAGLHNVKFAGEAASADHKAAEDFPETLRKIIEEKGYQPEQVFNADETGLFWKRMPSRTYISKEEKSAPGFKVAKDRLTLLLCANASGDFMVKPMLVYKSLNPRAFKKTDKNKLPVFWRSNKKAWVTAHIFLDWFNNCFVKEVQAYLRRKNLSNKALLIIDNAPGHPTSMKLENSDIEILFLPPNTTSILQPLDQGLIATFKAYYTRRTFQRILEASEKPNFSNVMDCWKSYDIVDCIENIDKSIAELKESTINGCWRKLWPEVVKRANPVPDISEELREIISLARNVGGEGFEDMSASDIEEVINDNCNDLLEDDLEELLTNSSGESDNDSECETLQDSRSKMTEKTVLKALQMADELANFLLENDHVVERTIKTKRELNDLMAPYRELQRSIQSSATQTKITNFFVKK